MTGRRLSPTIMVHVMTSRLPVRTGVLNGKSMLNVGLPPQSSVPEPVDREDSDASLTQHLDRSFVNDYSRRARNAVAEMRRVRPRIT
jgi:hypothetical protein